MILHVHFVSCNISDITLWKHKLLHLLHQSFPKLPTKGSNKKNKKCYMKLEMCLSYRIWTYSGDRDGQTMLWAIFHIFPIKLKFQWAILSKFNIAISVVNALCFMFSMAHGPTVSQSLLFNHLWVI